MGIRVAEGIDDRIAAAADAFALQIQQPSDVGAAMAALRLARVDLLGLASMGRSESSGRPAALTPILSPVVAAPGGPLLLVEQLPLPPEQRRTVPEVLVRRLEQANVESAVIESPVRGGVLDALDTTPHAVVLRLFPGPGSADLPADWLDIAVEWVIGDLTDDDTIRLRVLGVEADVPAREAAGVIHDCGVARVWCDAVIGEVDDRIRSASLTFGRVPHLALAAGGPAVDGGGQLARYELLQDVARELAADLAYACIDFEPTFEGLATGLSPDGWQTSGGAPPNLVAATLLDEFVPDAYPYQVLSRSHVTRLTSAGDLPPNDPLGDGRIEINIGQPLEWMPRSPARAEVLSEGWELLAGCLVSEEDADELAAGEARTGTTASAMLDSGRNLPDLDSIVLEAMPHGRRSTRLTVLELAAWLDHQNHTDDPQSVSPVVATFARLWAAGLNDDARQKLRPLAPRLLGTLVDDEVEHRRRWKAVSWLVTTQAPAWLDLAGLDEAAERLRTLEPINHDQERVRAIDVLGSSITIAGRRIDITASIAGDDDHLTDDDQLAWEAWDAVTEPSAWVAASEAATEGVPTELAYATDLRVIECSRDERTRHELEATRTTVGNTAWTAALHAVAEEIWERGWRAADAAAREISGFTIRVEMGRIAKSVLEAPGGDDEFPEGALDAADRAARDALTRAAIKGSETLWGEHPWDAALEAARQSSGSSSWRVVSDQAKHAIGDDAWEQAMIDAREVVDDLLEDAPDVVARAVLVALAREACSAAARGVAFRAASVARAHGGDDEAVAKAAEESLAQTANSLEHAAFSLLEQLISP